MSYQTITVPAVPGNGVPVWGGGGPCLLTNKDANNTIYLNDDNTVDPSNVNTYSQLPALASIVVTNPTYATCTAGETAVLAVVPGGVNFFQLVELLLKTLLIAGSLGNGVFVYSGTPGAGDLILSIAAPGTVTDPFGNTVVPQFAVYGPNGQYIALFFNAAYLDQPVEVFSTGRPGVLFNSEIYAVVENEGLANEYQQFDFSGPRLDTPNDDQAFIELQSATANGAGSAGGNLMYMSNAAGGNQTTKILEWGAGWIFINDFNFNQYFLGHWSDVNATSVTVTSAGVIFLAFEDLPAGTYLVAGSFVIQSVSATALTQLFFNVSTPVGTPNRVEVQLFDTTASTGALGGSVRANTAVTTTLTAGHNYNVWFRGRFAVPAGATIEIEGLATNPDSFVIEDAAEMTLERIA
jgi:hypothetical protein